MTEGQLEQEALGWLADVGYSSLTYLKRLRVETLKIDQSFVRDMQEDQNDLAILEGIIGLAASFKRQVIAEGVETVAHGSLLLLLGCEQAQGFVIARPMPAQELLLWVAQWQADPDPEPSLCDRVSPTASTQHGASSR